MYEGSRKKQRGQKRKLEKIVLFFYRRYQKRTK